MAIIFPCLWAEDPLMFDDTLERKRLINQFDDMFGNTNFATTTGSNCNSEVNNSNASFVPKRSKVCKSLFKTERCDLFGGGENKTNNNSVNTVDTCKTTNKSNEENLGSIFHALTSDVKRTREKDVNQTAPSTDNNCDIKYRTTSSCVTILKLPDGSLYLTTKGPHTGAAILEDSTTNSGTSATVESPVGTRFMGTAADGGGDERIPILTASVLGTPRSLSLSPRQLFTTEELSHQETTVTPVRTSRVSSPRTTSRNPQHEDVPTEVSRKILRDLKVVRTIRRSAYADGDSLVEVQPKSLPGSPTMFAYRDPAGSIRVPMSMQCNRKTLVMYRSLMDTSATS